MLDIRPFTIEDHASATELWKHSEGVSLSTADSRENIEYYLQSNAGLSFVAFDGGQLVGAVLCGHDGRRGYLHHLAVHPDHQKRGIGKALTARCLRALAAKSIQRCHLFVYGQNRAAREFWARIGWFERTDLVMMSCDLAASDPP
jgi:ribosomal protein S18 acetylase RimI-like enzyme